MKSTKRPVKDPAFAAEIAAIQAAHHQAWLERGPGDGLAIVEVLDEKTRQVIGYERVEPRYHAFEGAAAYQGSKCQGHRCPATASPA